jgi:2-C-methyl-D-erythritol 2,4-cyclodiphosphate synthase
MNLRIGFGHDIHRTAAGRPLVLGGVTIPSEFGLLGHSDADVVLHAVCDALLGATGMGDIGELFPDTDPRWRGAASRVFVRECLSRVAAANFQIVNLDLLILAERPKLGPLKGDIRDSVATLLRLEPWRVNVKAGTNEGLDAVGRGEAIACTAVVLLHREE